LNTFSLAFKSKFSFLNGKIRFGKRHVKLFSKRYTYRKLFVYSALGWILKTAIFFAAFYVIKNH
jgi:hypothetical protein